MRVWLSWPPFEGCSLAIHHLRAHREVKCLLDYICTGMNKAFQIFLVRFIMEGVDWQT